MALLCAGQKSIIDLMEQVAIRLIHIPHQSRLVKLYPCNLIPVAFFEQFLISPDSSVDKIGDGALTGASA